MNKQKELASQDYREIDRDHVWHPIFQHQNLEQVNLTIFEEAQGTTIIDTDGRQYLDAYSGLWNVNIGYGRQEIADAVYQQMQKLSYYPHSQINIPATLLAKQLADLLPGDLNHVYFSNSGSEANETAIKIARQYGRQVYPEQNRHKIISRYRGYHGFTYGAMSATGQSPRRAAFEPLVPGFNHVHPTCVDEIIRTIRWEGAETVVAIIAEPIIGGGGVILPPDDYFAKLREICDQHDLLLIIDEVITGFGRTGAMFACEHWNIQPDIITLAKGLTSGYLPLSACVATTEVFNAFLGDPGDKQEFGQVCTYAGHPVTCAAGLANLKILTEERLWENAAKIGTHLLEKLKLLQDLPVVSEVRGKGLMIGIELVDANQNNLETMRTSTIVRLVKERGILIGKISHAVDEPENIIFIAPPLILTLDEADRIFETLKDVLTSSSY